MKKIIVIGCPGSGKSTFSRALKEITGLPLYHLDLMYWNSDGSKVKRELFRESLERALNGDKWIIDGNYASTMEMRISCCDTVIFLDYPTEVCIEGLRQRQGTQRADMPFVKLNETEDAEFLRFIIEYNTQSRPQVLKLLEQYPEKDIIIFKNRTQADSYLERKRRIYTK